MKLKTETINGREIDIEVDANGYFSVVLETQTLREKDLDVLREKTSKAISVLKQHVSVDITLLDARVETPDWQTPSGIKKHDGETVDCVLRGVNPRTRNLLITLDGKKCQVDIGYGRISHVARRLTEEERTRFTNLTKTAKAAKKLLDEFVQSVAINPENAVKGYSINKPVETAKD